MKLDYVTAAVWLAAMASLIGRSTEYAWLACLAAAIAHLRLAVGSERK